MAKSRGLLRLMDLIWLSTYALFGLGRGSQLEGGRAEIGPGDRGVNPIAAGSQGQLRVLRAKI